MSEPLPPPPPPPPPQPWAPPPGFVPPPPPPGYVAPSPIIQTQPSPFRKPFFTVLGIAVLVGAAGAGAYRCVTAFTQVNDEINGLARGPLPVADLGLEADARETIYIETDGIGDGDSDDRSPRAERLKAEALAAAVTVTGPTGQVVVEGVGGASVYDFGREGIAVGRIAVPEDGTYRIEVQGFSHSGDIAVGDVSFGGLVENFAIGLGLFFAGLLLGIPLLRFRRPRSAR